MNQHTKRLCSLGLEERIVECDRLLASDEPVDRAEVCYFKANALYELDDVVHSLSVLNQGLAEVPQPVVHGMLLTARALCLHDLSRLSEADADLDQVAGMELGGSDRAAGTRAMASMVTALVSAARRKPEAMDMLVSAADSYRAIGSEGGESWALSRAATLAVRAGRFDVVEQQVLRVSAPKHAPTARLALAEAFIRMGLDHKAAPVVAAVMAGDHGPIFDRHSAYQNYLAALQAWNAGDLFNCSVAISRALDYLDREPREGYDLRCAINELRARLAVGKEVA